MNSRPQTRWAIVLFQGALGHLWGWLTATGWAGSESLNSSRTPLLNLPHMVEIHLKLGLEKITIVKNVWKPLVCQEYVQWAQKPDAPG